MTCTQMRANARTLQNHLVLRRLRGTPLHTYPEKNTGTPSAGKTPTIGCPMLTREWQSLGDSKDRERNRRLRVKLPGSAKKSPPSCAVHQWLQTCLGISGSREGFRCAHIRGPSPLSSTEKHPTSPNLDGDHPMDAGGRRVGHAPRSCERGGRGAAIGWHRGTPRGLVLMP